MVRMNKLTRRQFLKHFFWTAACSLFASSGLYIYSRYIEPGRLEIKKINVSHPKIPKGFDGLKIVQFSDTHLNNDFTIANLERIVNQINRLNPDIIVFTGDLIDEPNSYPAVHQIAPILKRLRADFGKFAIYGNHDHGGYGTDVYRNILQNAEFHLLQNEKKEIQLIDGSKLIVAGLDDVMLGRPDFHQTMGNIDKNYFTILLAHEPDTVLQAKNYNVDLQLSGHSHGGQVKIPFIGPLYTPPYAKSFSEGFYTVDHTKLYVNRGLGTTRLPFRFLAVPEITLFTLYSK